VRVAAAEPVEADPVAPPESPVPSPMDVVAPQSSVQQVWAVLPELELNQVATGTQVPSPVAVTSIGTQVAIGTQVIPPFSDKDRRETIEWLVKVSKQVGKVYDFSALTEYISPVCVVMQHSGSPPPRIHQSTCSWNQHYSVLSFLMNGHLRADYERLSGWLGLPPCSRSQWQRVLARLEPHVTKLAEWSCGQVRQKIVERGDKKKWIALFDGFYLTRGHYSNNSSATIHDHKQGGIAWFTHRTKRGPGHNWVGTSGGTEGDMYDELGFSIAEIITDKDSSGNAIFCRHFPEGTITYCSNHCAKTLHKDLERIKKMKCEVSYFPIRLAFRHLVLSLAV
jgi:hypothetical protein